MPTSRGERTRAAHPGTPETASGGTFLAFERGGVVRLVVVLAIGLGALLGPRFAHAERTGAEFTDSVELTTTLRAVPDPDAADPADAPDSTDGTDDGTDPTEPTEPTEPTLDPLPENASSADEPPVASWFVTHRWARQAVAPGD